MKREGCRQRHERSLSIYTSRYRSSLGQREDNGCGKRDWRQEGLEWRDGCRGGVVDRREMQSIKERVVIGKRELSTNPHNPNIACFT